MTMTLAEAIAEVKCNSPRINARGEYLNEQFLGTPSAETIVMSAVINDNLIPASDARLAVAAAYQRAGNGRFRATVKHEGETPAARPWYEEFWAVRHDAILALAPADDLAEVAELRAERDEWKRLYWLARSFAVHDDNCTINRHPHYRDCSCGLRAALQPTTPEGGKG